MRYFYSCAECGAPVTKTPTGKEHGLHGWRCTGTCNGPTKVKRVPNKN